MISLRSDDNIHSKSSPYKIYKYKNNLIDKLLIIPALAIATIFLALFSLIIIGCVTINFLIKKRR